ncbi:MAG TPA: hypothetical protein P5567_00055 [Kiritimatiellia bacterium]|nr:hypothetical protein [Kiritimatiellia bacterium]HRZ10829.1 hypothetical protein [Kiritimatiellia bacterium]HSA18898.1 hypothetical protein [Kiritimatiellia bacterium]
MRTNRTSRMSIVIVLAAALTASAQGPNIPNLINYQGRLLNGTNLFNGKVSISFRFFDAPTGGAPACVDSNDVPVADGLYSTYIGNHITWGSLETAMMQTQVWIEVVIGTNTLSPREQMVAVGYARYAAGLPANAVQTHHVGADQIYGFHLASGAVSSNKINWAAMPAGLQDGDQEGIAAETDPVFDTANHQGDVTGVWTAMKIAPGAVTSNKIDWAAMPAGLQDGDDGYSPLGYDENGAFAAAPQAIGNNAIALGYGAVARADYSAVGGGRNNIISNNANYSTIAGGDDNRVGDNANYAALAGGVGNRIANEASYASLVGGWGNQVGYNAWYGTIGGGYQNEVSTNAQAATVAGGNNNRIAAEARNAVIAGGLQNRVYASATNAAIGGGSGNMISNVASYATIGGGGGNRIGTNTAYAAIGGGKDNHVNAQARFGFIGGGTLNTMGTGAEAGTIGGGSGNTVDNGATYATVGGGQNNQVGDNSGSAVIAGGSSHSIGNESPGAAIGGGNLNTTGTNCDSTVIGGGQQNDMGNNCGHSVIGGGEDNDLGRGSHHAVVAGGQNNDMAGDAFHSFMGGGWNNKIESSARLSFVGGGEANVIRTNAIHAVISGGDNNVIGTNAGASVIGGGYQNQIGKDAQAATIPGGYLCKVSANANGAFAAGTHAVAAHEGSFVLTDSQMSDHTSAGADTLNTRFQGGIHLNGGTSELVIDNTGIEATGPCRGTYPRPDYDSGWQAISLGGTLALTHSLGGDTDDYVVDIQFNDTDGVQDINQGSGQWTDSADRNVGAFWRKLTATSVEVYRASSDPYADEVRVRIWVYQ